ncbi:hypothetical protein RFI_33109, partial [Reticulomyxa filosa]
MKLFDLRIDAIITKLDEMLQKNEQILNGRLKYIYIQSSYLQYKLKQYYKSKYTLVIPKEPISATVKGAAQLPRVPHFISSRIVKYTYGVYACLPIEYAQSHSKVSQDHISKYKYICDIDNKVYVKQCLVVFVNRNEAVKVGQVIQHSYSKTSKREKAVHVKIYRSEEGDPGVITKCTRLGEIKVPYPANFNNEDKYFIRFYFGETVIRVTVTIKGKEYVEKEQQINYKVPDL